MEVYMEVFLMKNILSNIFPAVATRILSHPTGEHHLWSLWKRLKGGNLGLGFLFSGAQISGVASVFDAWGWSAHNLGPAGSASTWKACTTEILYRHILNVFDIWFSCKAGQTKPASPWQYNSIAHHNYIDNAPPYCWNPGQTDLTVLLLVHYGPRLWYSWSWWRCWIFVSWGHAFAMLTLFFGMILIAINQLCVCCAIASCSEDLWGG